MKKDKNLSKKEQKQAGRRQVDNRSKYLKRFSVTATVLFIAVILILNIVFDRTLGQIARWDWTGTDLYSIGEVSKEVLSDMDKQVEIVGLFDVDEDTRYASIRPMLDEYVSNSKGNVSLRYVDPDRFPSIIDELDPEGFLSPEVNTFVVISPETKKAKKIAYSDVFKYEVDYNNMSQYLTGITAEQSFTGAIKYVLSETTPVVYFTTGHEEADRESQYSIISQLMTSNNYEIRSLDLFGLDRIPEDCSILMMASPKKDISQATRLLLFNYLRDGGSLMLMAEYSSAEFPVLNELLLEFNIELSNDRIREGDRDHRYQDDPYVIRAIAPAGKVSLSEVDGFTLVDQARGINELLNTKEWIEVEAILTTSDQGVAETGSDTSQSSAAGIQNIAVLSENKGWMSEHISESAKVLVVGSSSLFSDSVLGTFGTNIYNPELFYNSIQFLSGSDAQESLYIEAKMPASYTVTSGDQTTNVMVTVLVMLLIPAGLLISALVVYRKRKHL